MEHSGQRSVLALVRPAIAACAHAPARPSQSLGGKPHTPCCARLAIHTSRIPAPACHLQDSNYEQLAEYKQQIDDLREALQVGSRGASGGGGGGGGGAGALHLASAAVLMLLSGM